MKKKRILVVDDDKPIRILLAAALTPHGYEVDIAGNGVKAISCIENGPYDLIITDYMMPEMDGIELTRWTKEKYPSIPILILTADGLEGDSFLKSGATACLRKPFEIAELQKMITIILDEE